MALGRAREKLHSTQPKLSVGQLRELYRKHATGEYSISDLAELFSVSRPTVYRTLNRRHFPLRMILTPCILTLAMEPSAADRYPQGHDRPSGSEGRRAPYKPSPNSIRGRTSSFFGELPTRFVYTADGTHGVPRRARAFNCNSSLRITATKATLPGFPRWRRFW